MKLSELRPGMEKITLTVKIVELNEIREITTNYGFTHRILDGMVEDESGKMSLTIWNEQIEKFKDFKPKQIITIIDCFISSFKGSMSVNIGRESDIRI